MGDLEGDMETKAVSKRWCKESSFDVSFMEIFVIFIIENTHLNNAYGDLKKNFFLYFQT